MFVFPIFHVVIFAKSHLTSGKEKKEKKKKKDLYLYFLMTRTYDLWIEDQR